MDIRNGTFLLGDCLEILPSLLDNSIDMVLCDLPYGTTACKWDAVIPFEPLWREIWRVLPERGAAVLTASQPFTTQLIGSQIEKFRHEWIWQKNRGSNFASVKFSPFKEHESVCIFGRKSPSYFPQMEARRGRGSDRLKYAFTEKSGGGNETLGGLKSPNSKALSKLRYPSSVQKFNTQVGLHPTQKPVALFEYLIRTYTNPGGTVLDMTAGSGTTAVAAERAGRKWVCIERDEEYYWKAAARLIGGDDG